MPAKPKPQDGTLSISPYAYKSGVTCFALHFGDKPTKDTILFEAQERELVERVAENLRAKFAKVMQELT